MDLRIAQNSENFFTTQEPLTSKWTLYSLELFIRADVTRTVQKPPAADKTFMHRPAPLKWLQNLCYNNIHPDRLWSLRMVMVRWLVWTQEDGRCSSTQKVPFDDSIYLGIILLLPCNSKQPRPAVTQEWNQFSGSTNSFLEVSRGRTDVQIPAN